MHTQSPRLARPRSRSLQRTHSKRTRAGLPLRPFGMPPAHLARPPSELTRNHPRRRQQHLPHAPSISRLGCGRTRHARTRTCATALRLVAASAAVQPLRHLLSGWGSCWGCGRGAKRATGPGGRDSRGTSSRPVLVERALLSAHAHASGPRVRGPLRSSRLIRQRTSITTSTCRVTAGPGHLTVTGATRAAHDGVVPPAPPSDGTGGLPQCHASGSLT